MHQSPVKDGGCHLKIMKESCCFWKKVTVSVSAMINWRFCSLPDIRQVASPFIARKQTLLCRAMYCSGRELEEQICREVILIRLLQASTTSCLFWLKMLLFIPATALKRISAMRREVIRL